MANKKRRVQPVRSSLHRPRRHGVVAFVVILLVALGLRLWDLGDKSLWMDEIFTVEKASMPLSGMMSEIKNHDAHPPLFQLVEWAFLRFGHGDGYARLPSVIFGVIGVGLMMAVARRLFGRNAALAAGVLGAISFFHVYYSQEARLHAMAATLVLAQFLLLLKILARRGKTGWGLWAAYGLVALASLYTYALCILSIGALALLYLWRERKERRQWAQWFAVHAVVGALFLPWVPTMQKQTARIAESLQRLGDAAGRPSFEELMPGAASWAVGPHPWQYLGMIGTVLGIGVLCVAALALVLRRGRRSLKLIGAAFVLMLAGYLALPMPRVHEYDPKHIIFVQPFLLLAFAGAWGTRFRKGRGLGLMPLVLLILLPLNLYGLSTYYQPDYQKENWRGLAADVTSQLGPDDLILFNPAYIGFAFDYYAKTDVARAGIEAYLNPQRPLRDFRRLWLVECRSPVAKPMPNAVELMEAHGWFPRGINGYAGSHGELGYILFERTPPPPQTGR
jgi:4-amino-4-deoxy-L-arabinose transferase-like glycosyltransferase